MLPTCFCIGHIQPEYVPPGNQQSISIKVVCEAMAAILPVLVLVVVVLGSIFAGIATVTEASGLGAVGASVLAIVHWLQTNKRKQGKVDYAAIFREGWQSCIDAFSLTGSIVGILIGATCFAFILRELGGDKAHSVWARKPSFWSVLVLWPLFWASSFSWDSFSIGLKSQSLSSHLFSRRLVKQIFNSSTQPCMNGKKVF